MQYGLRIRQCMFWGSSHLCNSWSRRWIRQVLTILISTYMTTRFQIRNQLECLIPSGGWIWFLSGGKDKGRQRENSYGGHKILHWESKMLAGAMSTFMRTWVWSPTRVCASSEIELLTCTTRTNLVERGTAIRTIFISIGVEFRQKLLSTLVVNNMQKL